MMRNFWLLISVLWLWTCSGGGGSSPTEPQDPAPVSNFTATPTTLIQGQSVTFTSTSTGTITSYAWNVDADPAIEGTTATYSHTYTEVGTYSVTLTVTGPGGSNPKTVADMITVSTAAPTPTTETSQTVQEDGSTTISLTATDPNGQAVTFAITTDPTNGTATLSGTEITYTPNANFYGTDSFDYTASNGTYTSDPVTITITIEGEDDGNPTTNDVSATTDEDTVVTVNLDATEIDGDNYSFSIISQPSNGTLGSINGNQVEYTPNQDWNGTDTFTFEATDDRTYRRNVATATITVNAVNDAPVANDVTASMDENKIIGRYQPVTITLDATDVEGDALTYFKQSDPSNGTLGSITNNQVVYTPTQDFNGEDTFIYKATDGNADSNGATVTITIASVNDAPETQDQSASTNEDTAVTITLSVVDVDTQQGITRSIVSSPSNGSVVLSGSANQTATYTPTTNWNGTDTFTWKANDGELDSNVSTVTITVAAVNDAPTTEDVSITIDENRTASRSTGITLQGSDVDGDNLTYTVVSGPSNGNASIAGSILTYAANQDWNGTETITYKANDGTVDSNTSTVTITINSVNDAPVTQNVSFTTDEDTPYTESYSAYVSDVEGDNLTIIAVTNPTNGTATCDDATNCTYTPNQDFNGTDSFTYKVNDGELDSNVSTVTVTVTAVNDAPVANDMTATMDENKIAGRYQPVTIFLNATDVDGDDLTYSVVGDVSNGTLGSINGNQIIYTPTQDYNGEDTFTYKANDGNLDSNTATVSITINSVNDAPVTTDQTASTNEDTAVDITLTSSDVESDTITFSIVSDVSNGTTTLSGATVTYTPSANFNGTDTFTFKANDGTTDSNTSTVTITVAAVNDAPTINEASPATLNEDSNVAVTLSGTDIDGDTISFSVVTNPSNGSVALSGTNNQTATYTPNANYNGSDSFIYKANDGTVDSGNATIFFTVTAVNDAPTTNDISASTNEDTAKAITLSGADVDGDNLTYQIVESVSNGTLTDPSAGDTVTYTPGSNFNGTDTFTYKANDGTADSNTATVTITVTAVNDAPIALDITTSTNEDASVDVTLDGSDVEGDSLTYSIVSDVSNGSTSLSGSTVTYTPTANYNGTDTFTYKANDGTVDSNTATVTVTVASVNDAPTTNDISASTNEDTAKAITLSGADVDGDDLTYSIVSDVSNGSTSLSGSTVTYTPTANYNGTDTFTYKVNDGTSDSNTSTVTITVSAINDAPTTSAVSVSTNEDTAVIIQLVGSDVDTGDSLTYSTVSNPSNGSLSSQNGFTGRVTYTPTANYNGTDTFTFKVNDGTTDSNTSTVTITVAAVDDAPIANNMSLSLVREASIDFTLDASDPDGDSLSKTIVSQPDNGTLLAGTGLNYTYTPDSGYHGSDSFTYKVNDGTSDSDVKTVSFDIDEVIRYFEDDNVEYRFLARSFNNTNYLTADDGQWNANNDKLFEFDDSLNLTSSTAKDYGWEKPGEGESYYQDMIKTNNGYFGGPGQYPVNLKTFDTNFNEVLNLNDDCIRHSGENFVGDVYGIDTTVDNGFIMGGYMDNVNSSNGEEAFIRKCDSSGSFVWQKEMPIGNVVDEVFSLSDGTFFVTTSGSGRGYRVDSDGEVIWSSSDLALKAESFIEINEILYIHTACPNGSCSGNDTITKIDFNGNILDTIDLGNAIRSNQGDAHMILHSSGDIVVAGFNSGVFTIRRLDVNGNDILTASIDFSSFLKTSKPYVRLVESSDNNIIVLLSGGKPQNNYKNGVFKIDISNGTKLIP